MLPLLFLMCYLIGQSAIWRSVLSLRFNKIQTHKTVTIYTQCISSSEYYWYKRWHCIKPGSGLDAWSPASWCAPEPEVALQSWLSNHAISPKTYIPAWVVQLWLIQTDLTKLVVIPTKLGWMSKWLGADINHNQVLGNQRLYTSVVFKDCKSIPNWSNSSLATE